MGVLWVFSGRVDIHMPLSVGARLGPYEVLSLVGVGGMGEVYKARDTRLDRTVAIKLLPVDAAGRADRRSRFETEARAISSLSHPHVCTLFDIGDEDGRPFLVMEYLEGETLDDRLTRGALPAAEVLRYGVQIADALAHAHDAHIIHRDLKPSNVMLTASGVKVLDFGLARRSPVELESFATSTVSFEQRRHTAEGTIIGTFQYMAPEQLEGREADERTDIFALGMSLYEMATGHKAFTGDSQASLIASILTRQPPSISTHSATRGDRLLVGLDHLVDRCLAKDPEQRWQTARDVKLELEWIAGGGSRPTAPVAIMRRVFTRERLAWAVATVAVAAAVTGVRVPVRDAPLEPTRFIVSPPAGTTIGVAENRMRIAISPDGRRLAIVASTEGKQQIWLRSLDSVSAEPLPGTDGAVSPFWSPNSRLIGFFSPGDGALKKVELTGGPARTICPAQTDGGATWGRDGTILFTQFLDGIYRVSADGGMPTRVTQVDKAKRELNHYWPEFLPDGRHFLYMATALEPSGVRATPTVYVASLDSSDTTLLTQMHSRMAYASPGYLVFVQDGALLAQTFDSAKLRLTGEPVRIADGLAYVRTLGNGAFTISANGTLAYQGAEDASQIRWYDRSGNVTDATWPKQNYGALRFSRDGQSVAVDVYDPRAGTADIWIFDTSRGTPIRFTSDPADESGPVWSPDDERILFRTVRGGPESLRMGSAAPNLHAKAVATGIEEPLVSDPSPLETNDWSPDGRWIIYTKNTRQTGRDLWLKPVAGDGNPHAFSNERFEEFGAGFAPDSRWVAFVSTESGPPEVYVAPVQQPGQRKRISTGGGTTPRWSRDGRELFYASADNRAIMRVQIEPGSTLTTGLPTRLFSIGESPAARDGRRNTIYDVSPDGKRFLVSVPADDPGSSRVTVVLNWTSVLKPEKHQ
jgi:Tol biopolymer transport system component